MNSCDKLILYIGTAIISMTLSSTSVAQTTDVHRVSDIKARVHAASTIALDSAAHGNVKYAIKLLNTTLKDLPPEKENNIHVALLHFNLGYIYRHYGYDIESDHLSIAVKHFQTALDHQPDDQKIINNLILVLRQKGDDSAAIEYLEVAIKKDPAHEGNYYSVMGDIHSAQGSLTQAWEYYRKAAFATIPDPEAGRKLIKLYDGLQETSSDLLYKQCKEFDTRDEHTVARLGYEKILGRNVATYADIESMDASLLRWVAISAKLGFVTPQIFHDAGLENSTYPALQELQTYLREWSRGQLPNTGGDNMNWWRKDARHEFHLMAFEKSFADYVMRNGSPDLAVVIYENVLDKLWQRTDYSTEIYGRPDVLITDVLIDLARVYNHPKFKMEDRWKQLESRLFEMKGDAYVSNDLASRQKYHTILGQIYFDRGEFSGYGFQNAEFQLRNAINVAEKRAAQNPETYYPIPNLHQKLASVYQTEGKDGEAFDALMNAATGYLESDQLRKCEESLNQASNLLDINSDTRSAKYQTLKAIVTVRNQIPNLSKEQFNPNSQEYFQKSESFKWLLEKSPEDILSSEILNRQRFKALSDLSERAAAVGATEASIKLSSDARTEMKEVKIMSSQQDVVRMRHLEVTTAQYNYRPNNVYKSDPPPQGANEKSYKIATPPGDPKQEVIIDKQSLKKQRLLNYKVQRQE